MKCFLTVLLYFFATGFATTDVIQTGKPWQGKAQTIPGRVQCEWYDEGGEGVAYHDADSINNGSGKLNPANGKYLNEFRMHEGADISYTKTGGIDDNPFNKVMPEKDQLYLGWTQPGEWVNYTIQVAEPATYNVNLMYTSNAGGTIALDIDGKPVADQVQIASTYDARDTSAWRQWHHWNKLNAAASFPIKKGIHILTLRITEQGNMNFDYLELEKK